MAQVPTRQKMIETAVRLFQRHGYHATSWRMLVEEAGTPWGSAHHHFPDGKEQLGVAAIELGGMAMAVQIEQIFAAHRKPAAAIRACCRARAESLERSGFVDGCPVATVALEAAPASEALTAACKRALDSWSAIIAAHLVRANIPAKRANELATLTVLNLEGALILSRVARSTAPILLAGDQLAAMVDSAVEA